MADTPQKLIATEATQTLNEQIQVSSSLLELNDPIHVALKKQINSAASAAGKMVNDQNEVITNEVKQFHISANSTAQLLATIAKNPKLPGKGIVISKMSQSIDDLNTKVHNTPGLEDITKTTPQKPIDAASYAESKLQIVHNTHPFFMQKHFKISDELERAAKAAPTMLDDTNSFNTNNVKSFYDDLNASITSLNGDSLKDRNPVFRSTAAYLHSEVQDIKDAIDQPNLIPEKLIGLVNPAEHPNLQQPQQQQPQQPPHPHQAKAKKGGIKK